MLQLHLSDQQFYCLLTCIYIWFFRVLLTNVYGSGHETVAVLLPGFAINWWQKQVRRQPQFRNLTHIKIIKCYLCQIMNRLITTKPALVHLLVSLKLMTQILSSLCLQMTQHLTVLEGCQIRIFPRESNGSPVLHKLGVRKKFWKFMSCLGVLASHFQGETRIKWESVEKTGVHRPPMPEPSYLTACAYHNL